jgi:hypothetical protein
MLQQLRMNSAAALLQNVWFGTPHLVAANFWNLGSLHRMPACCAGGMLEKRCLVALVITYRSGAQSPDSPASLCRLDSHSWATTGSGTDEGVGLPYSWARRVVRSFRECWQSCAPRLALTPSTPGCNEKGDRGFGKMADPRSSARMLRQYPLRRS